jgi:hypothetical protein
VRDSVSVISVGPVGVFSSLSAQARCHFLVLCPATDVFQLKLFFSVKTSSCGRLLSVSPIHCQNSQAYIPLPLTCFHCTSTVRRHVRGRYISVRPCSTSGTVVGICSVSLVLTNETRKHAEIKTKKNMTRALLSRSTGDADLNINNRPRQLHK